MFNEKGLKERKYKVDFIGDNTHQTLPQDKVVEFEQYYYKYSQTKKKVNIGVVVQSLMASILSPIV